MLTKRADINVGYSCNERCKFCYYIQTVKDHTQEKDLSTKDVKKQMEYIARRGIETLEFTGGEPTIRPDLLELISYAKSLGFRSLSMITNGIRLAQADYARACVKAGLDDFLISIHGHKASVHDRLTEIPGSFDKALKCISNLRPLWVRIRVNCVICGYNYKHAPDILALYQSLQIQTANFILFNPIVEADWRSDPDLNVAYAEAAPYLKEAIDLYKEKMSKITIRYIPFCLMQGYEAYVTNMLQLQYDPDEWDYVVRTRIREGLWVFVAALWLGMLLHPNKKRLFQAGWNVFKHEGIKYFLQRKNKAYGPQCGKCSYKYICDGLWKKYAQWKGFEELKAMDGAFINDPTQFLQKNPNFHFLRQA